MYVGGDSICPSFSSAVIKNKPSFFHCEEMIVLGSAEGVWIKYAAYLFGLTGMWP